MWTIQVSDRYSCEYKFDVGTCVLGWAVQRALGLSRFGDMRHHCFGWHMKFLVQFIVM